jgi:hypothetical protein
VDITELMVDAIGELKESSKYTDLDQQFLDHPLVRDNYASLLSNSHLFIFAAAHDHSITGIIKMLMIMCLRIGVKIGRQQIMDEFIGREKGGN